MSLELWWSKPWGSTGRRQAVGCQHEGMPLITNNSIAWHETTQPVKGRGWLWLRSPGGSFVLGAKRGSGEVTITITGFSDQRGEELLTRSQHCQLRLPATAPGFSATAENTTSFLVKNRMWNGLGNVAIEIKMGTSKKVSDQWIWM